MNPHIVSRCSRVALMCLMLSLSALIFFKSGFGVRAQQAKACDSMVEVTFSAVACANGPFTVTLNTGVVGATPTTGCAIVTFTNIATTQLILDKPYPLVACCNICSSHIYLHVPPGYTLYLNGVEQRAIDTEMLSNTSGDGTWEVVVRKECSCGDEDQVNLHSVDWSVNLGTLTDGRSAESMHLRQEMLNAGSYMPSALVYSPPGLTTQVDVVKDAGGALRQIYAPENLADIVTLSANEYDVRLYKLADVGAKTGGLYPVSGVPLLTWKVKNPNPPFTNRLQLIKTQGATTETHEYTWDAANNLWTLAQGGANGTRVETQTESYPSAFSRLMTNTVTDGNGLVASKTSRNYLSYPFGERLVQQVSDPDGAALTTAYTYYENAAENGKYGQMATMTNPDGSWEKYDYDVDRNLIQTLRSWKDVAIGSATVDNCRATIYVYDYGDDRPAGVASFVKHRLTTTTEMVEGKIVRLTSTSDNHHGAPYNSQPVVYDNRVETNLQVSSANIPSTTQATTTTIRYAATAPQPLTDRLARIDFPDGRCDFYGYEKGDWTPNVTDPSLSVFTPNAAGLAERETLTHGITTAADGVPNKTGREVTIRDRFGRTALTEMYVYTGTIYERVGWTAQTYDNRGNLIETRRHNGQLMTAVWNGDMKASEINENGEETTYTYDALMRVKTQTKKGMVAGGGFPAQSDIVTTFNYDAEGRVSSQVVTAGALSLTNSTGYDPAGRVIRTTDQTGLTTTTEYANSGRTTTVRLPGGATQITDNYLDGQIKTVSGTATVMQTYDYGTEPYPGGALPWIIVYTGPSGVTSPRWTKTFSDWQGHQIKTEQPSFTGTNRTQWSTYNNKGQLILQETKAGAVRLQPDMRYEYDLLGNQVRSGSDNNNSNSLTLASLDRITDTDMVYEKVGLDWFKKTLVKNYLTDNNATPTTVQTQKERLNNFATSGTEKAFSESRTLDVNNNQSIFTTWVDRAAKKLRQVTDTADSTQDAVSISVNGLLQSSVPSSPRTATTYGYDALGRQLTVTDPATGTTTNSYDAATGRLLSVNDGIQTTTTSYYPNNHANAGRVLSQTNGAGKKIYFDYSVRGEQTRTWGDASYPLEYVYNSFGERTELHTYRAGYNWPGPNWPSLLTGGVDVTMWIYHPATGLLTTKRDAANKDTVYSYDAAGRLLTRTWARLSVASAPIVTTYAYAGNALELSGISYSDGTPNITFSYDRNSRQKMVTDAAGTRTRTFNTVGATLNETFTAGMLNGIQVSNGYDGLLRRQSLSAAMNATSLVSQAYGYDVYGRMGTIVSGAQTVTYGYYPTTGLLNTTSYTGGTNLARVYDSFGRLQTITTTPAAGGAISYTYQYDSLNRRNKVTREDGSYWSYGYNDRGELVFGKKFFADNTPVAGMQFEYGYDNIGNRQATKAGGNDLGTGLRNASYTANNLNQYTQRTVPGTFDVMGTAATGAAVTVNTQATYRKSDYFQKEIAVTNAAGPVYQQVDVVGAKNNAGGAGEDAVTTQSGKVYVPQATETYAYDLDGNLTQDGRWVYTWDAENRLTSMTAIAAAPVTAKRKLEFAYDYMGRRIEKKVYDWNVGTSAYVLATTTRFVYDGWNLMAEVDGAGVLKKSYVWGKDVSGSLHGAGGIGGLLIFSEQSGSYHIGYDGNDNVVAQINAANGVTITTFEYGPYGIVLNTSGDSAAKISFQLASKYYDKESDLTYYGYRYYEAKNGRWLSRDNMGEVGGVNLYGFVGNDGTHGIDYLGNFDITKVADVLKAYGWTVAEKLQRQWFDEHYFDGAGVTDHKQWPSDTTTIKMDWVLKFSRASSVVYGDLLKGSLFSDPPYKNDKAKVEIRKVINRYLGNKKGNKIDFGSFVKPFPELHDEHVQTRGVGTGWSADELTAALANFNFHALVKGCATDNGSTYTVQINEVGVYVKDSYDFIDEPGKNQFLGYWRESPAYLSSTWKGAGSEGVYNSDYRNYRQLNYIGRDYKIYSDVKSHSVSGSNSFTIPK